MSNFDIVGICLTVAWLVAFIATACQKERGATMEWHWFWGIPCFMSCLRRWEKTFDIPLRVILYGVIGAVLVAAIAINMYKRKKGNE